MALPAQAALIYLPFIIPICFITVYLDLSRLKIPNWVTDALLVAFIPLGLIALPFGDFLWQLVNPIVMLLIGMLAHALRLFGGGDSKFLISASPYVFLGDLSALAHILMVCMAAAFLVHRFVRNSAFARQTENWVSWTSGKRFPLGFALGPAFAGYLIAAALS